MTNGAYISTTAGLPRTKPVAGILPGSLAHQILLGLRGPGGMSSDQVYARFTGGISAALTRLKAAGHIDMPEIGSKGKPITLTDQGRAVIAADGPLARRNSLITYCQL